MVYDSKYRVSCNTTGWRSFLQSDSQCVSYRVGTSRGEPLGMFLSTHSAFKHPLSRGMNHHLKLPLLGIANSSGDGRGKPRVKERQPSDICEGPALHDNER